MVINQLTYLLRQEWNNLGADRIQPFCYLRLQKKAQPWEINSSTPILSVVPSEAPDKQ